MSELIRANVEFLRGRVKDYEERIRDWQTLCTHEVIKGEYKSNTGNYDPSSNSYWITAECLDCGIRLHADSETELYHHLSRSGMIASTYDDYAKRAAQDEVRQKILTKRREEIDGHS